MLSWPWAQAAPAEAEAVAEQEEQVVPSISGEADQAHREVPAVRVSRVCQEDQVLTAKQAMMQRKTRSTIRTAGVPVETAAAAVQQAVPVLVGQVVAAAAAAAEPVPRGDITDLPVMAVLAALQAAVP